MRGELQESIHANAPEPLENCAVTISYYDASLCNNVITRRHVTRVLHFASKIPIELNSKKQSIVETATHGSEQSSDRTHVEKIIDLHIALK